MQANMLMSMQIAKNSARLGGAGGADQGFYPGMGKQYNKMS